MSHEDESTDSPCGIEARKPHSPTTGSALPNSSKNQALMA